MTSLTPLRGRKRIGLDELSDTDLLEDELGDAVAVMGAMLLRGHTPIDPDDELLRDHVD